MTVPNPKGRCEVTGDNTHRSLGTVKKLIVKVPGTSLVAQRLGHCTSNVESVSSNPTQGTKIPDTKKTHSTLVVIVTRLCKYTRQHWIEQVKQVIVWYVKCVCVCVCVCMRVCAQSCPTLFDPMECSPPGSPVHGIIQARILEWAAISSSRGSS